MKSSEVLIFKQFQKYWLNINIKHFPSGIKSKCVKYSLDNDNTEIIKSLNKLFKS